MEISTTVYNDSYNFNSEVWKLIIHGSGDKHKGLDSKSAAITTFCCKFFNALSSLPEIQNGFWKNHFLKEFPSYKKVQFKVNVLWKNEFWQCATQESNLKTTKILYCLQIIESNNDSVNKNEVYQLIKPLENYLSDPKSNSIGQYCFGSYYLFGWGVSKNFPEAFKYLKFSADQGHAEAQNRVAVLYAHGEGVGLDLDEAFKYYKLAAGQGLCVAQENLASCFLNGRGTESDEKEAFKCYSLSADKGSAVAQFELGNFYDLGIGIDIDKQEAFKNYKLSADQGNANAQNVLGNIYESGNEICKINLDEAFKYIYPSANQGNADAQYSLGNFYFYGSGSTKINKKEAFVYFLLSADQGYAKAQNNVGYCYEFGEGVESDMQEALRYYKLAADQGNELSLLRLAKIAEEVSLGSGLTDDSF